jgi:ABC-2 type transport system ATP-binding protein
MAVNLIVDSQDLSKSYGSIKALDAVTFDVRPREIFGFIGADGSGKTTAFRIMGGVLEPGAGKIRVLDKSPREARPGVGYLTQPFSLYMDLSVDENLNYAGGLREVSPKDFAKRTLREKFDASRVSLFGDRLRLVVENDEQKRQSAVALKVTGGRVDAEKSVPLSLEDVFISLIESRRSEIPL